MNKSNLISVLLITLVIGLGAGYWLARHETGLMPGGEPAKSVATMPRPDAKRESLPYQSAAYRFDIQVQPERPVVGSNRLRITLADRDDGSPVTGAGIRAVAKMAAMGAMPAMQAPAEMREVEPGVYEGEFKLSMEGAWPLDIRVEQAELGETRFSFDLATGRRGLEPSSGVASANGDTSETQQDPPGTITVDARRQQLIGVTYGEARLRSLTRDIRAVGRVTYDETRVADVSLKYDAWVGELKADYVGKTVERGQLLFSVYSPELYSTQQEYLDVRRRGHANLLAAVRQRLRLWNMAPATIEALEKRDKPFEFIPIFAPRSGIVVEKNIVAGTAQKAGATLLRIADLSRVWVEAELYEAELPLVEAGLPVEVQLPYLPGERFEGEIEYIYPYLDERSRTGRIRLSLANDNGLLRPDMYAEVTVSIPLGERLSVPEEAVLVAGDTRVVFEDLGDGRLAPRRVQTGRRTDGYVEILDGLEAGARVVTSGNFLIAAESKLKSGIKQW